MIKSIILPVFMAFGCVDLDAEDGSKKHRFVVDRPDVTESPFVIALKSFQLENGFDYLRSNERNEFQIPNFMLRTGITHSTEIRFALQHGVSRGRLYKSSKNVDFFIVSIKQSLFQAPSIKGTSAAVLFNWASNSRYNILEHSEFNMLAAFQFDFSSKKSLGLNLGFEKSLVYGRSDYLSSLSYSIQLNSNYACFFEYYNVLNTEFKNEHGFDLGLTYSPFKNTQFDCLFGFDNFNTRFASIGFAYRFDPQKKRFPR